ncbi:sulfatase [Rossellomorea sp. BNER]|uniref:sulfatase family protein n=1 Tax=Rossellomorea sp. BNER TaxID=2962031 RepID=UPI003AF3003F|nr:sulfatase [Rossellomorea sp. BNER]
MSQKRPNLIYLFADQWRRQAVGYAKEDPVYTPNIDQFALESMTFTQALTCNPLCSPHRASLLTGKYPMSTGVYTNCKVGADVMLQPEERCISDVLKDAGYATGYIGKWHLDLPELQYQSNPESGASGWDAYTPPGPKRHGFDEWYSYGAWDDHLSPHYWQNSPEKIKPNKWSVEHETDKAIEFINSRNSEEPFALFVSWNPPHSPFDQVPQQYKDIYKHKALPLRKNVTSDSFMVHTGEKVEDGLGKLQENQRDYFAAITGIDENFGRILDVLKELQIEEDTIIVLTSDHGEMMGSHGLMAKHVWYEESIGVPFLIRWPGKIPSLVTHSLLNTVDIMPTLLTLIGLPVPSQVEGTDLSPVLKGERKELVKQAYLCAYPGRKEAIEQFRESGLDNRAYGWRGIRTKEYMYVVHRGYSPGEKTVRMFYDLERDPYQLEPEVMESPQSHFIAHKLEEELAVWITSTNDPFIINNEVKSK